MKDGQSEPSPAITDSDHGSRRLHELPSEEQDLVRRLAQRLTQSTAARWRAPSEPEALDRVFRWRRDIDDRCALGPVANAIDDVVAGRHGVALLTTAGASHQTTGDLGVLSAAYDPPTRAHLELARAACEHGGVQTVLMLVSVHNPDKESGGACFEDRLLMLKHGAEGDARLQIGAVAQGLFVDQLRLLQETGLVDRLGASGVCFIVGHDTIERVLQPRYYHYPPSELRDLLQGSRFLVAERFGPGPEALEELVARAAPAGLATRIRPLPWSRPLGRIAATTVRQQFALGRDPGDLAHPTADLLAHLHGLYRTSPQARERYAARVQWIWSLATP
jgi:nicotinic acid mononucleotide adenylyltransferase